MPFFGRGESRESGRVTFHVSTIFVIVPWLKVSREVVELLWCVVCYSWMMFRVDGCLNEDPGALDRTHMDRLPL